MNWQLLVAGGVASGAWAVFGVGLWIIVAGRRYHKVFLAALSGLERTHLQGFEALMIEIDRLKKRVKELERR